MSRKTIGRIVGALFLLAFVVYIAGSALMAAGVEGVASGALRALAAVADNERQIGVGALLMLVNSAVVAAIGVLVLPVLREHDEVSAHGYLIGRAIEAVMLAVGIVFLLLLVPLAREYVDVSADLSSPLPGLARVAQDGNHYSYQIAMISLGVAGLLFSRVLLRARLVPGLLAVWGLIGYATFLLGAMLEILGYGVGVALSIPGGLFEVALGVLLLVRGFPETRHP